MMGDKEKEMRSIVFGSDEERVFAEELARERALVGVRADGSSSGRVRGKSKRTDEGRSGRHRKDRRQAEGRRTKQRRVRESCQPQGDEADDEGEAVQVDAVMLGSGETVGGKTFEKGKWYGCGGKVNDKGSYFPIVASSLTAPACTQRSVMYETTAIAAPDGKEIPQKFKVGAQRATRAQNHGTAQYERLALGSMKDFCRRNPGVAVITDGPGARERNDALEVHFDKGAEGLLLGVGSKLDCVPAAVVNGVMCFLGREVAEKVESYMKKASAHIRKLGQVTGLLHKAHPGLNLRKPYDRKLLYEKRRRDAGERDSTAFGIVGQYKRGVWLVRLTQVASGHARLDHCVAVDGQRGLILDSSERYPIRLSAETLEMCGGPNCPKLEVAEVMQLVVG